jgi:hypothetical protein
MAWVKNHFCRGLALNFLAVLVSNKTRGGVVINGGQEVYTPRARREQEGNFTLCGEEGVKLSKVEVPASGGLESGGEMEKSIAAYDARGKGGK